jgi:hypothetical protein
MVDGNNGYIPESMFDGGNGYFKSIIERIYWGEVGCGSSTSGDDNNRCNIPVTVYKKGGRRHGWGPRAGSRLAVARR